MLGMFLNSLSKHLTFALFQYSSTLTLLQQCFFCEEVSCLPHLQVFTVVPKVLLIVESGKESVSERDGADATLYVTKSTRTLSGHLAIHSTELWEA